MGCRLGGRLLGYCFSVCLIFIFLRGWEYRVSASVCLVGCTPSEVGFSPSEVSCSPSEVFVIWFLSGGGMSPEVLYRVSCLWLSVVVRSARGCIGFVEVWDWGGVPSGNFFAVSLKNFNATSYCV